MIGFDILLQKHLVVFRRRLDPISDRSTHEPCIQSLGDPDIRRRFRDYSSDSRSVAHVASDR